METKQETKRITKGMYQMRSKKTNKSFVKMSKGEKMEINEHYHLTKNTEDGLFELTIMKATDGKDDWIVEDNWGDFENEREALGRFDKLPYAIKFCIGLINDKSPEGVWFEGAGFPKDWEKYTK